MKHQRHAGRWADLITVDGDSIFRRVDRRSARGDLLTVHLHSPRLDEELSSSSRGVAAVRDVFVESDLLLHDPVVSVCQIASVVRFRAATSRRRANTHREGHANLPKSTAE